MQRLPVIASIVAVSIVVARPSGGNAAGVIGHYGFIFSGTIINSAGFNGPIVGEGEFHLDGLGNVTGRETFNVAGTVCSGTLSGTYTTSPPGSGQVIAPFKPTTAGCPSGTVTLDFTAVDGTNKLYLMQIARDKVVSGIAERK
jgi:hypothetical protein